MASKIKLTVSYVKPRSVLLVVVIVVVKVKLVFIRPFVMRTVELCFAADFLNSQYLTSETHQNRQGKLLWIYVV